MNTRDPAWIEAEFSRRRRRLLVAHGLLVVVVLASVADWIPLPNGAVQVAGWCALLLAWSLFMLFNGRCPACSDYVSNPFRDSLCSHCGIRFR